MLKDVAAQASQGAINRISKPPKRLKEYNPSTRGTAVQFRDRATDLRNATIRRPCGVARSNPHS